MRPLLLFLLCGLAALPARAQIDADRLGSAHFVGLWSLDGPAGCAGGDTLSIYASGAWALTSGGGNPVEALGTWALGPEGLTLRESGLQDRLGYVEAVVRIDAVLERRMEITVLYRDGRSQAYDLDRCPG